MIEIKIGILLDACGIDYSTKQLSKLEGLINTFIQTQISKYVQTIDTGFSESDPIAIQKEENIFDDKKEVEKEIKIEGKVWAEDIDEYEKNTFVSEHFISEDILEKSVKDVKKEVEENRLEPMPDLNLKEEITYEDNKFVCLVCKLTFESKVLIDLHQKLTHNCELTFDQRKYFKWSCPCCSKKFSDTMIYSHVKFCEIKLEKANAGCLECGKKFNFETPIRGCSLLKEHMLKVHKKECQICEESFETNEKFKEHIETVHKKDYCIFCCRYFSPEDLANHDKDQHICDICQMRVHSKSWHIKLKHEEKVLGCKYCDKAFSIDSQLQSHILQAHIKPLSCDSCDYTCGTQSILNIHKNSHVNVNNSCEECNLTFNSNYRRKIHVLKIHEKKFDYECSKCNKKFCVKGQLSFHMKKSHASNGKEKQLFCCEYCSKQFKTLPRLKGHINMVHLKIKNFPCEQCDKSFFRKYNLQEHSRIEHSDGIKKFLCADCGNCYLTSQKLHLHNKTVHGSKNFECDKCHKCFALQRLLNEHVKKAHGVREEKCPQCDKCFTNKTSVTIHIRSVHATRSHCCKQCNKGFGSTKLLKFHVKSVHGEKSHKCTLCSDMFPTTFRLKSHMEQTHDMSRPFHCLECSKTFNSKELLEHHVARAHEMRNCEICPHCSKQFSRLKAHLLICSVKWSDTERRKFECRNCDKTYLDKGSLNKHIKKSCKAAD